MKRFLIFALALSFAVSCTDKESARITATIAGASDTTVVLQKLNFKRLQPIDTIRTDASGHFDYKVSLDGVGPYFYYLYEGDRQLAALVLSSGDEVTVNVAGGSYEISGSKESETLKKVNEAFAKVVKEMSDALAASGGDDDPQAVKVLNEKLSKLYINYKRAATKQVIENPNSITSVVVLFQKINDNLPVFNEKNDAVIFRRTLDSLALLYPTSEYVTALRDETEKRESFLTLSTRLSSTSEVAFPEIAMPDINGEIRKLSAFEGKVIILSFWSVSQNSHKMFNNELAALYDEYHDKGLEIYQVGLDVDKPVWATAVRNQGFPWVSVNDGLGIESSACSIYNVQQVPSIYVLDKEGKVVLRDEFDRDMIEKVVKSSL